MVIAGIHKGDNTHHQDQVICPVSLRPINKTASKEKNGFPSVIFSFDIVILLSLILDKILVRLSPHAHNLNKTKIHLLHLYLESNILCRDLIQVLLLFYNSFFFSNLDAATVLYLPQSWHCTCTFLYPLAVTLLLTIRIILLLHSGQSPTLLAILVLGRT